MGNSTKQVNKVKPNVNRNANENVASPGYNSSRYVGLKLQTLQMKIAVQ